MEKNNRKVPPNQVITTNFYVLNEEETPLIDIKTYKFKINGLVEEELELSYDDILSLPKIEKKLDFHCVTGWSMLDTIWGGVSVLEVLKNVKIKNEAKAVIVKTFSVYTTNLTIEDLMRPDNLLVYEWNKKPISLEHGYPLRLFIPFLYAWKSAKWTEGFEFVEENRPGYWESRGYHRRGDPFKEERYSF